MAITNYDFYANTYYGDSVDESLFAKYLSKATDKLQMLTDDGITDSVLLEHSVKVQKAVCGIIDVLYKLDYAEKNANTTEGNIKSMSSGGQSVTFGNNETVYSNALGNHEEQMKLLYDVAVEYLFGTGLLYKGV